MNRVLFLIISLLTISIYSQDRPGRFDVIYMDTLTTTERDAISLRPSQASMIFNSTDEEVQLYNGTTWVSLGGTTYTAGDGIDITGSVISADESYLDGVYLPLDGSEAMTGNLDMGDRGINNADAVGLRSLRFMTNDPDWHIGTNVFGTNGDLEFNNGDVPSSITYTLNSSGTPANDTDLINKAYADANYSAGTDDQTASEVPITDAGNHTLATNVEDAIEELFSKDYVEYREFAGGAVKAVTFPKISSTNVQIGTSIGSGMFFDVNGNLQLFKHQDYTHKAAIIGWSNTSIRNYQLPDKDGTFAMLDDINGSGSIADNSVTSAKIANGVIINEDIADNTIEGRKLVDATIVGSKIANGAVDTDRILNSTILEEDLSAAVQTKLNTVASGSDSGQSMSLQTKTDVTETFNNSDVVNSGTATDKRKFTTFTGTNEITLDDTITLYNQPFLLFHKSATGSTTLKKGTGTTFIISDQGELAEDGVTFTDYANASVIALSSNEYLITCSTCTAFTEASDLYEGNNAMDINEVNGVANLGTIPAGLTVTSSTEQAHDGTYSIKAVNSTGGSLNLYPDLQNIESGDTVSLTVYTYRSSGSGNVVVILDDAYGWSGDDSVSAPGVTENDAWYARTVSETATSGAPKLRLIIPANTTVYFDLLQYTK